MPVLLCKHLDRRTEWRVSAADGDITIGCSDTAQVPFPDSTIAAKEARISRQGDRFQLQDLAEKGRVLLGGTVTRAGLLKNGDRLRIGRVSVIFLEDQRAGGRQVELSGDWQASATEFELAPLPVEAEAPVAASGLSRSFVVWALLASLAAGLLFSFLS